MAGKTECLKELDNVSEDATPYGSEFQTLIVLHGEKRSTFVEQKVWPLFPHCTECRVRPSSNDWRIGKQMRTEEP